MPASSQVKAGLGGLGRLGVTELAALKAVWKFDGSDTLIQALLATVRNAKVVVGSGLEEEPVGVAVKAHCPIAAALATATPPMVA
jgi:hypothetical protein